MTVNLFSCRWPMMISTILTLTTALLTTGCFTVEESELLAPTPLADVETITAADGAPMVSVPAGPFEMGHPFVSDVDLIKVDPVHTVTLDEYYIDQYEVTNARFAAFLNDQGNQIEAGSPIDIPWYMTGEPDQKIRQVEGVWQVEVGFEDHPVHDVRWYGAKAYCEWRGDRLPTEAEWEKAARGTDGRAYPWGNDFDGTRLNSCDINCDLADDTVDYDDGYATTAPVGSYPEGASPYGALDMVGNVSEWTSSIPDGYPYDATDGREDLTKTATDRVVRSSAWGVVYIEIDEGLTSFSAASRMGAEDWVKGVGFRCAR